ncbi:MAG: acyltransferase family protein [Bacteroidales bacterium]|nr:acyltransferase family protein [Bacteroidales bacterium]
MKKRITWIDWAKVLCIWLMVSCHAGQKGMVWNLTYQFHMPAFFIISGILFHPKGVGKELKALGIPVLLYSLIQFLWKVFFGLYESGASEFLGEGGISRISNNMIKSFIMSSDISCFQGYWFVFTLLLIRLLMEWRFFRDRKYVFAIVFFLFCCIEPYLNIPVSIKHLKPYYLFSCLPFFVAGMGIKEKGIDIMTGKIEIKMVALLVFFILTQFQGRPDLSSYSYGINYSIFFLNAIIGSFLIFNFCNLLPNRYWIQVLSTGTLLVLGLHSIIYPAVNTAFVHLGIANSYLPLLTGIITLALLYPIIKISEYYFPILLGKSR